MTTGRDERVERGRQIAEQLSPPPRPGARGGLTIRAPKEIAREWRRFLTATVMGDVYARPGLDLKTRSLLAVAGFAVLVRTNELELGIRNALHMGVTREEICEVIWQMAIYGGVPAGVEGMRVAADVFDALDAEQTASG